MSSDAADESSVLALKDFELDPAGKSDTTRGSGSQPILNPPFFLPKDSYHTATVEDIHVGCPLLLAVVNDEAPGEFCQA